MFTTRGGLVPAKIREAEGATFCNFMFNPNEYTIAKSVNFETTDTGSSTERVEISSVKSATLTLPELIFDTYEEFPPVSVTDKIAPLFELLEPVQGPGDNKPKARKVIFEWGTFNFTAYLESVTQRFTLFRQDGMPVRAHVTVALKEFREEPPGTNPTSGGGPIERVHRVMPGDRLDTIAAAAYGDATKWRMIAEHNQIHNPLLLRPGQELGIPEID